MAIVQTTYTNFLGARVDGQIADTTTCDVDSYRLAGAAGVPFGRMVQPSQVTNAVDKGVDLGVRRTQVAMVNGAINNSNTTLVVDEPSGHLAGGARGLIDTFIMVGSEILHVTGATSTDLTVTRGALGSSAAAIADDVAVYAFDSAVFTGLAIMDERLPGTSAGAYVTDDPVSVLWRGDVVVKVSAAVVQGQSVVAATVASGTDATVETVGQLSAKAPSATHIAIPGARFETGAAAQGLAIVRLTGPAPTA